MQTQLDKAKAVAAASERRVALVGRSVEEENTRLRQVIAEAEATATARTGEMQMVVRALKEARAEQISMQRRIDELVDGARKRDETGEYTDTFEEVMQDEFRAMREAMQKRLDAAAEQLRSAVSEHNKASRKEKKEHAAELATEKGLVLRWRASAEALKEQVAALQAQIRRAEAKARTEGV